MKRETDAEINSDEALLKEMRERYDEGTGYWEPKWAERDKDMRALSVDGDLDTVAKAERKTAGSPISHTDIISQYNNRVVNNCRMRKRGFTFMQTGDGANDKTVQLRESRARQIQHEAKAFPARLMALQNAVDGSIGHWKIGTERTNPKTFDQQICYERILNIRSVVIDFRTRKADRSDMKWAFHIDKHYTEAEFQEEFDGAQVQSFDSGHMNTAPKWITKGGKDILVAQYWRVEKQKTRLLLIEGYPAPGQEAPILETDLPPGAKVTKDGVDMMGDGNLSKILRQERTDHSKVMIYLTNGVEILEPPTEWLGTTIPIITVVGREKYIGDELEIESLTRKLRQPQLDYDLAQMAETADVGMSPKPKWLVAVGQIDGLDEWTDASKNNYPYLRYYRSINGVLFDAPQRIDSKVDMTKYEVVKNSCLRAAQNAVGMTSADSKDRVSKSGIAQQELNKESDIGAFHFTDNWDEAIEYEGRIINEIMDKVEDTTRMVGLRSKDDQYSTAKLSVQQDQDGNVVDHSYGASSDHGVTVEVGPDYESQRDALNDFNAKFLDSLKGTALYARVIDLIIRDQNGGPLYDQMADRLVPADIQQAQEAEKNGQQPIPAQFQQKLQATVQHNQQLQALVKEQAQKIDSKTVEMQAKKDIELGKAGMLHIVDLGKQELEIEKLKIDKYKIDADLEKARIAAGTDASTAAQKIESDQRIVAEDHALEFDMARLQHHQGMQVAKVQQDHAMANQDQAQQNAMELGDQQHGQNLEAAQQQADLAPEPAARAGE